jgi:hypothetical protein
MNHHPTRALAGVLVAGLLLAGCSGAPQPVASSGSPSASATGSAQPSGGASPSPTSTLTAEEQQAFEDATAVVLAYRQTITDLYSGARTNLNDLNEVAAGEKVERDLIDIQKSLGEGWTYEPKGGQVSLASARPLDVDLSGDPATITVRACIDTTAITDVSPSGKRSKGIREELDYTLVQMTYLPKPGWAVTKVTTEVDEPLDRRC